ncbi:Rieske (2Fe-2S) protein [Glaciihabitans sp. UYNi722]|uniref:QcrA and Rieske domain-containing protein n=1 Tax=Glaciihabitans sp. UYNi722 TaxID=3156344 RepID=UPI00339B69F0
MNAPSTLTRRSLITAGSVTVMGAGALVLAACSPAGAGNSGASDSSGGGSANTPKVDAGTEVVKLADIPVGGTAAAKIGDAPVLLAQPTEGKVVCFSAICTHQGCVVDAAAKEFDCACHGSKFEAATGKVLHGPAVNPLEKIAVKVSGDAVVTA